MHFVVAWSGNQFKCHAYLLNLKCLSNVHMLHDLEHLIRKFLYSNTMGLVVRQCEKFLAHLSPQVYTFMTKFAKFYIFISKIKFLHSLRNHKSHVMSTYLATLQLTPRSQILLKRPTIVQPLKKSTECYNKNVQLRVQ
jgi:hypothetical protein